MSSDPKCDSVFNVNQDEWDKITKDAIKIWENLENVEKETADGLETDECPMSPAMFFQLSGVRGFNKANGYTYDEYVSFWRKRRCKNNV